jgi:hypothetical protein
MEKAWHAVNEMVESEERYVQKLALLDKVNYINFILNQSNLCILFAVSYGGREISFVGSTSNRPIVR